MNISDEKLAEMNVLELRTFVRDEGLAHGKGVSASTREELEAFIREGIVPQRVIDDGKAFNVGPYKGEPIAGNATGNRRGKAEAEAIPTAPEHKQEAPSAGVSASKISFGEDGLAVTEEDRRVMEHVPATWAWWPKNWRELRDKLLETGYMINDPHAQILYAAINGRDMKGRPARRVVFDGVPGAGKTELSVALAKILCGTELARVEMSCHSDIRPGEIAVEMAPSMHSVSGIMEYRAPLARAAHASKKGCLIVHIDELDKARQTVEDALLGLMQSGEMVHGRLNLRFNTDNIIFTLAKNDVRDMTNPFLRRVRTIQFKHPHPLLVERKLTETVPSNHHGQIATALQVYVKTVYAQSVDANMTKPATMQELYEFIESAYEIGVNDVDFNQLVYSTITKTPRAHQAFLSAQNVPITEAMLTELFGTYAGKLETSNFTGKNDSVDLRQSQAGLNGTNTARLPRGSRKPAPTYQNGDKGTYNAVVETNEETYDALARLAEGPGKPGTVVGWDVYEDVIVMRNAINVQSDNHRKALATLTQKAKGMRGEIKLVSADTSPAIIHNLTRDHQAKTKIACLEEGKIIVRFEESEEVYADILCTDKGVSVITPIAHASRVLEIIWGSDPNNTIQYWQGKKWQDA